MKQSRSRSNLRNGSGNNLTFANYSQSNTTRDADCIMFFVIPDGLTEDTCSPALISAYQLALEYNYSAKLIHEQEIRHEGPKINNIFVCDPFTGPAYEYLQQLFFQLKNFLLIGPQVIKQGIQGREPNIIITNKGYPFYTLGMQNICISFTGFTKEVTTELTDMVQKMNGVVSKAYSVATTHVVAAIPLTAKCNEAYKNDVPVMSEGWIREVWEQSQREFVDATDERFVKFTCPVFHNIKICVSQVPSNVKNILEKTITQNGGSYSKDFVRYVTNVLVTPYATGEKYKFSKTWKIPCVTPEWVDKSKQAGHILPLESFEPPNRPVQQLCSTQIDHGDGLKRPDFNLTACTNISEVVDLGNHKDVVNCTATTECISMIAAKDISPTKLDILHNAPQGFLDGCMIYLCEFNNNDEIRKVLNGSGALRLQQITDKLSHILVVNGKVSDSEVKAIKSLDHCPYIVTLEWLLESATLGNPAPEENFICELFKTDHIQRNNHNQTNNQQQQPEINHSRNSIRNSQHNTSDPSIANNTAHRTKLSVITKNRNSGVFVEPSRSFSVRPEPASCVGNEITAGGSKDVRSNIDEVLFTGFKFKIVLDKESETQYFEKLVQDHGGELPGDDEDEIDFLICSFLYQPHELTVRLFHATKYWLLDAITQNNVEQEPEQFHHIPLVAAEECKSILYGVVIYISNYSSDQKSYISTLATFMGAVYQDVFSKKDTKSAQKTTHLICSTTDNDKYKAAVRWGTPTVTCDWIIACYNDGQFLDIKDFLLDKKDHSDSTISMYMNTPRSQKVIAPKTTNAPSAVNTTTNGNSNNNDNNRGGGTSFFMGTGTSKPKESIKTTENKYNPAKLVGRLDFDSSDLETPPPKVPISNFKGSAITAIKPPTTDVQAVESPLFRPGMSREASKQLKRALELASEESPQTNNNKRRKSTPLIKIHMDCHDVFRAKASNNLKVNAVAVSNNISDSLTVSKRNLAEELQNEDDDLEHDDDAGISMPKEISKDEEEDDEIERVVQEYQKKKSNEQDNKIDNKGPTNNINNIVTNDPSTSTTSNSTGYASHAGSRKTSTNSVTSVNDNRISTKSSPPPFLKAKLSSQKVHEKLGLLTDFDDDVPNAAEVAEPVISWIAENNEMIEDEYEDEGRKNPKNDNKKSSLPKDDEIEIIETRKSSRTEKNGKGSSRPPSKNSAKVPSPVPPVETCDRITRRGRSKQASSSSTSSVISSYSTRRGRGRTTKGQEETQPLTFIISGSSSTDKAAAKQIIERLGGNVSEMDYYDKSANAVIAYKVTRSEKILGAVAGGKPILRPEYLQACVEQDKLVQFDDFIWREEDGTNGGEQNMARVANAWYKKIQRNPKAMPYGKFKAWVVEPKESKREAYIRLIQAGGGEVVSDENEMNIVIGDGSDAMAKGQSYGVPVKIPMFLNEIILSFEECAFLSN